MKQCKNCKEFFYNPYVDSDFCSITCKKIYNKNKYCENKNKTDIQDFLKEIFNFKK